MRQVALSSSRLILTTKEWVTDGFFMVRRKYVLPPMDSLGGNCRLIESTALSALDSVSEYPVKVLPTDWIYSPDDCKIPCRSLAAGKAERFIPEEAYKSIVVPLGLDLWTSESSRYVIGTLPDTDSLGPLVLSDVLAVFCPFRAAPVPWNWNWKEKQ